MSQLVRLEGKHSTQNAHCAVSYPVLFSIHILIEFFNQFRSTKRLLFNAQHTNVKQYLYSKLVFLWTMSTMWLSNYKMWGVALCKRIFSTKKCFNTVHILCEHIHRACVWKCKWRQQTTTWANHCWNVVTHTFASQDNQMYPRHKILWCVR